MQVSQDNTSNFSKARVRGDKGNTDTQVKVLHAQIRVDLDDFRTQTDNLGRRTCVFQ